MKMKVSHTVMVKMSMKRVAATSNDVEVGDVSMAIALDVVVVTEAVADVVVVVENSTKAIGKKATAATILM